MLVQPELANKTACILLFLCSVGLVFPDFFLMDIYLDIYCFYGGGLHHCNPMVPVYPMAPSYGEICSTVH